MRHETAANSPLAKFLESRRAGGHPIPLVSTSYSVDIRSGLAVVKLVRTFRNVEKNPIEATVTFPVPFDAAVTGIEAKANGRLLTGRAQAKVEARQAYEDAIDGGKPAVLHEELLRGLHMLSVANVAPGAEVEVAATFVVPLSLSDGNGRLRIPVTIGQVYGQVPLVESDAPMTGGPVMEAEVDVVAASGTAFINGGSADGGKVAVKLDRPIEIKVVALYKDAPEALSGRAADGKTVTVGFRPDQPREAALDIDVLLDVSGSMRERIESNPEGNATKWDAVRSGLQAASGSVLTKADRVSVWTFANDCSRHGEVAGDRLAGFMGSLPFSSGGTELPGAVATVAAARSEPNVLLVTDGKSWNRIDVQAAVAAGARFTVVLVGEDSLESSVGYLAAMTGGQMFVVAGSDVHRSLSAALASMRGVSSPASKVEGAPTKVARRISGSMIDVAWSKSKKGAARREGFAAAVAGFAAHLAIQGMEEDDAAKFAQAEGIVSHLTSIVLVDEAAEAVEGTPASRKVALASPATAVLAAASLAASPMGAAGVMRSMASVQMMAAPSGRSPLLYAAAAGSAVSSWGSGLGRRRPDPLSFEEKALGSVFVVPDVLETLSPQLPVIDARMLVGTVEWDSAPDALASGDLTGLQTWVSAGILALSSIDEVKALAHALGLSAVVAAVALLADADATSSRTASRIARKALAKADKALLGKARKAAGLE